MVTRRQLRSIIREELQREATIDITTAMLMGDVEELLRAAGVGGDLNMLSRRIAEDMLIGSYRGEKPAWIDLVEELDIDPEAADDLIEDLNALLDSFRRDI